MPLFITNSGGFKMNIANLVIFSFLTAFPSEKPTEETHRLRFIYLLTEEAFSGHLVVTP